MPHPFDNFVMTGYRGEYMPDLMPDWLISLFVLTGGLFWILAFAWLVGFLAEKIGITK